MEEKKEIQKNSSGQNSKVAESFKKGISVEMTSEKAREELREILLNPTQIASQEEIDKTQELIKIEKEWWKNYPAYENLDQIKADIEKGILEEIKSDNNFRLIMRLRNPELKDWLPYLEKNTGRLFREVGNRWREKMTKEKMPEEIFLAVTNLLVTADYQKKVALRGKLAVEGSSHSKGHSFDIDGCGYYLGDKTINPRQTPDYEKVYVSKVHAMLVEVLEEMKKGGLLNFIREFPDSNNQSFHITRNPHGILN